MKNGFLYMVFLIGLCMANFETPIYAQEEHGHEHEKSEAKFDEEKHEGHDEGGEDIVRLSAEDLKAFGIETAIVEPSNLEVHVSLPGEVVVNPDRFAHIVPRVSGVVQRVNKKLGDRVRSGDILAVLDSRELSDLKSSFLAARERLSLAEVTFDREDRLWKDGISSEREYLAAKQMLAEMRIEARSAEQKLHALGFSDAYLTTLSDQPDVSYTQYEISAPFDGIVVAKHITLGENVKDDAEIFSVADLRSVWVALTVYQKDLPHLKMGDKVHISAKEGGEVVTGLVSYISPTIDEVTRTATARIVLPNQNGQWRPGLFVTGAVEVDSKRVAMLVPKTALQNVENRICVFVQTEEGFEPQPVVVGQTNMMQAEILEGLHPGLRYVTQGAFTLKAQLEKGAFGDGHNH
ncbi:MAG: cobalt-zinc-cadmium efflux system membrane fusion protein [Candidatus Latescibacterota bacterium]